MDLSPKTQESLQAARGCNPQADPATVGAQLNRRRGPDQVDLKRRYGDGPAAASKATRASRTGTERGILAYNSDTLAVRTR